MEVIEIIKEVYPTVYYSARDLYEYKKEVYGEIDRVYGMNTYESIVRTNEFHKEIENVQRKKVSKTRMNEMARKYWEYFERYCEATYGV